MKKNQYKPLFVFIGLIFCFHTNLWGIENPFIGTWVHEDNSKITIVFTEMTYTNYYDGVYGRTARYTYDSEKIMFTEIVSTRYGNMENKWNTEYTFVDNRLILGDSSYLKKTENIPSENIEPDRTEETPVPSYINGPNMLNQPNESKNTAAPIENNESFANRLLIGLSYSYPFTFGISSGYMISDRTGIYLDMGFSPADFGEFSENNKTFSGNNHNDQKITILGDSYINNYKYTNDLLSFIAGANIQIFSSLFFSAGLGVSFPVHNYTLYTQESTYIDYNPEWISVDKRKGSIGFVAEAGILYVIKFIYITGKYRYINNSSTFCIGAGLVFDFGK